MDRRIFLFVLLSLLLLTGWLSSGSASADSSEIDPVPLPVWGDELLVPGSSFTTLGAPSLALDPVGNPHFVYGDNHLFHTWFDGVGWQSERVDTSHAWQRQSVLAINAAGTIFIADYENNDLSLRILEPGGSWRTVRAPFPHMESFSIVLDSKGWPHVVAGPYYYNPDFVFIHGTYGPSGWSVERILADSASHESFSIAIDRNDRPVILYERYDWTNPLQEVRLARYKGESWQHDLLGDGCLQSGNSLVVDAQDKAHVLFSEDCEGDLTYAQETGQEWEMLQVTAYGRDPSLALDNLGRPHVVFSHGAGQVYATREGASWERTVVQVGENIGWYNQLQLDNAGVAHISSKDSNLQYATNGSGQWQISTPAVQVTVGERNALALDSADSVHVLYHTYENHTYETGELYWASGNAGDLELELLANVPYSGLEIAIELDTQGRPHAAFLDADKNELLAGLRQAGEWTLKPIAAAGRQLSLAVDGNDRPHLALIQEDETLHYWTRPGEDWVSEVVADVDYSGRAWLALDSLERPHIVYSDENGSFLASRQAAHNWTREPLPFETVEKLAFGANDRPTILYSEERWEYYGRYPIHYVSLWFAERDGEEWSVEWLWEDDYWDVKTDLIVDKDNQVHVAFSSGYGDYEYMQREEGGAWLLENVAWIGSGDISMALGQDGQPRMLTHGDSSLYFSTREIIWLDKFNFLPVLVP